MLCLFEVFLHARKLLKFYGYSYSDIRVQVNKILNILTFIFFRFGVLCYIYSALYKDGPRVPVLYVIFLSTCVFLMSIINVVLFKRLLIKDFCSTRRPKPKSEETNFQNDESEMKLLSGNSEIDASESNSNQKIDWVWYLSKFYLTNKIQNFNNILCALLISGPLSKNLKCNQYYNSNHVICKIFRNYFCFIWINLAYWWLCFILIIFLWLVIDFFIIIIIIMNF